MKTAEQHVADIIVLENRRSKENREFLRAQADLEAYADLRDDVMRLIDNSRLSYADIHGRCGPHPSTLKAWDEKKIAQPRLGKLQSTLRVLGYDLGIVEGRRGTVVRRTHR